MSGPDEGVNVKIGSDTSGLEAGAKRAAKAIVDMGGAARDSLSRFASSAKDAEGKINGALNSITAQLKGTLLAYASFAGIRGLAEVSDQAQLAEARMRGVTGSTEAAANAQRQLFELSQRLQASYKEVASAFNRIMPAVAELGGGVTEATRLSEILISTAKLSGSSAAEASASALQFAQALGSGTLQGDELRSILEGNNTLARELARSLGVTIGELRKMGSEGKLTSDKVANALLGSYDKIKSQTADLPPTVGGAITQINNAWSLLIGNMESGGGVFRTISLVLTELSKVIETLAARFKLARDQGNQLRDDNGAKEFARNVGVAFAYLIDITGAVIDSLKATGQSLGAVVAAAQSLAGGNVTGAMEIMRQQAEKNEQAGRRIAAAFTGAGEAVKAYLAISSSEGDYSNERDRRSTGVKTLKSKAKPDDKSDSRMGKWEAELSELRLHVARMGTVNGDYQNMTKADEVRFWEAILKTEKLSTKEREQVQKKLNDVRLADAERYNTAMLRYSEALSSMQRAQEMADIDEQMRSSEIALAMGKISNEQHLAQLKQFEAQKLAIVEAALTEKINLIDKLDPEAPAKRAQLYEQLLQERLRYKERVGEIDQRILIEQERTANTMRQNFENAFMPVLQQFMRFQLSFVGLLKGLASAFVSTFANMIAQIIAKKLAAFATEKVLTTGEVAMNAAKAGSGAAASQAGIPIVGPGLALAAMGTVFAAVMGMLGKASVPSARSGFDIPAGLNPLTQLHEREMVLPQQQADVIRDMADGGGAAMPPIHIHAVDAQSVRRLFEEHGGALVDALRRKARMGALSGAF